MLMKIHPKMPFCAKPGFVIVELDYSNQEGNNAAALSNDPILVEAFTSDSKVIGPDGKTYPNYRGDWHAITAKSCINPDWFKDTPEHLIVPRSKEVPPGQKRCPRDDAKVLNFGRILPNRNSLN